MRYAATGHMPETGLRRRVYLAWGMLFLNVLPFQQAPTIFAIPTKVGKVITQGSLPLALLLVLMLNRRARFRPNVFLALYTLLAILSAMMSFRFISIGTDIRAIRLLTFVAVLWLFTPFWGREDMILIRAHLWALGVALSSVLVGMVIVPGLAFSSERRLGGVIWPMPPPQVAHYAGEVAGISLLLWLCGRIRRRSTALVVPLMVTVLLLTHTRTALIATTLGLVVAVFSLLTTRRKARQALAAVVLTAALAGPVAYPFAAQWLARGQDAHELTQLTGRTKSWDLVIHAARPETNVVLGSGLSNESIQGLSIDSSWLTVYMDQGLAGDLLVGSLFLVLIMMIGFTEPGPGRAIGAFLVTYVLIASFTETGVGNASTYALDLALAASLLVQARAAGRVENGELPLFDVFARRRTALG